jgi:hypothetical protein
MTDTVQPRAATGRLTVNPGDNIASTWGNTTYDQTMEVFDTAAQRDAQWPTPHDGALAYTLDTQTAWLRRSGAWALILPPSAPRGFLGQTVGPASTVNNGATAGTVISLTVSTVQARWYRVSAFLTGTQQTATSGGVRYSVTPTPGILNGYFAVVNNLPVGGFLTGSIAYAWQATATGSQQFVISSTSGTGGAIQHAANQASLTVEDAGA